MDRSTAFHRARHGRRRKPPATIAEYLDKGARASAPLLDSRAVSPPPGSLAEVPGLVSVVTTCLNTGATIDRATNSVRTQDYPNIEYIVIDGASTDCTIDKLLAARDSIDVLISEPDAGISDAFNKGIARSRGEYVMLVNSDDWLEPNHLSKAVGILERSGADYVFGDLVLHFPDGSPAYVFVGDAAYAEKLAHTMPSMNHPTVVCRRRAYERFGLFDLSLKIAMDYEWFLRVERGGGRGIYRSELVGHMALGGASIRSFRRSLGEVRDVSIDYGYPAALAWARFILRVLKRSARTVLRKICPDAVYEWLRRLINRDYRTAAR
jgi:glycosyltransferase involved in cell wall biosynthesis